MLGTLPRTLTPRDRLGCSFPSFPSARGDPSAAEAPRVPQVFWGWDLNPRGLPSSQETLPETPGSTHTSQRSALGCPVACGSGRWWTSGYLCRSCWPECSCRSVGKGGSERPGHGDSRRSPSPLAVAPWGRCACRGSQVHVESRPGLPLRDRESKDPRAQ